MGMFCILFTFINNDEIGKLREIIIEKIVNDDAIRLYDSYETIIKNNNSAENLEICFDAFSISLSFLTDRAKDFKNEEYGFDLNCKIYFNIFHSVKDWEIQLFKFLGIIMKNMSSDCVFEYCGDVAFIKKTEKVIVDESRTQRLAKFPYEELGMDYYEEKIILQ